MIQRQRARPAGKPITIIDIEKNAVKATVQTDCLGKPLGLGAVYYAHTGRADSHQVYLRYLNVRLNLPAGLRV